MQYRLRRAASVVMALSVLVALPLAGGAWLSSTPSTTLSAPAEPSPVSTSTAASVAAQAPRAGNLVPSYQLTRAHPDPEAGESVTDLICQVDGANQRCLPVKITNAIPPAEQRLAEAASVPEPTPAPAPEDPAAAQPLDVESPDAPMFDRFIPLDPQSAKDWRPLIELFFQAGDVDRAVDVVQCESHGQPDAKNPRSTASGLFQHLASLWSDRAAKAGYAGTDVFDPVANTAVAAWLVYEGGGWRHWNASSDCWG